MTNRIGEYINGYVQKKSDGRYEGEMTIDGIRLSPIIAVAFKDNGKSYIWLRRKDLLVYEASNQRYKERKREPRWEAYLEKQMDGNVVAYRGEFYFFMYKYQIVGIWDKVLGLEKNRMNFFVERLPMDRQDVINGIKKNRHEE